MPATSVGSSFWRRFAQNSPPVSQFRNTERRACISCPRRSARSSQVFAGRSPLLVTPLAPVAIGKRRADGSPICLHSFASSTSALSAHSNSAPGRTIRLLPTGAGRKRTTGTPGGKLLGARYAEFRMINRASRRSAEVLFAPSAIPCIRRSRLRVASRSTSCATVVSDGHAY